MDGYIERQTLQDIADAIREKNGSSDTYKPSEMAEAIRGIEGGGGSSILSSLIPYGFPTDVAEKEESKINEMLLYTKSHIKENMTEAEVVETQNNMLFYNNIVVTGSTAETNKLIYKPHLYAVKDITISWEAGAVTALLRGCVNLLSVGNIISSSSSFSNAFNGCSRLETLGELTSSWTGGSSPSGFMTGCNSLVNFGGINNLKWSLSLTSPKLSTQSVANIMKKAGENTQNKHVSFNATVKNNFLAECETNEEFMEIYNEFINIKGWTLT